jgi:hypothetical protein
MLIGWMTTATRMRIFCEVIESKEGKGFIHNIQKTYIKSESSKNLYSKLESFMLLNY